jgi:4-hydroxy-tetrahydrodipicolinate reductase
MGKMIEQTALDRNHEIVARVDIDTPEPDFSAMDVAIDFSSPDAAYYNITRCMEHNIPVICGTTGWLDRYEEAVRICNEKKGAMLYASNFSLGVHVFFELNRYLATLMKDLKQYTPSIEEIHHTQKLDAPSGTAITLAEGIISGTTYEGWQQDGGSETAIGITSVREGTVPGTHTISYKGPVDTLQIKHTAHNREGFAIGAVLAAEWIEGKTGVFGMRDVLNLG